MRDILTDLTVHLLGPISTLSVFGTRYILINDRKTASELLDKRSAENSERPEFTFAGEM